MLANPILSSFRIRLPKSFISEEVRTETSEYLKNLSLPYPDVSDYLNDSIIAGRVPGLSDPGTQQQTYNHGQTKTFTSGLAVESLIDKELVISFRMLYINWMILYKEMFHRLLRSRKSSNADKVFSPDIYLQLFDDEDRMIMEIVYREIQFRRLDDMDFKKQENGLISRTFDMTLGFNSIDVIFNTDSIQHWRSDEQHVY